MELGCFKAQEMSAALCILLSQE